MLGHMRWLILTLSPSLLLADVVELKTGERLEGTFKQANAAGVVIEVGGQAIDMPLEKVRAIYFGPAPTTQAQQVQVSPVTDALQGLKALQSATAVGVSYRDYATRVLDTKVKVDQFINSPQQKDTPARDSIRVAMRYYELASQAWSGHLTKSFPQQVGGILEDDPEINTCSGVKALIQHKDEVYQKYPPRRRVNRDGTVVPDEDPRHFGFLAELAGQQPAVLWSCAADKITEAERMVK